MTLVERARKDRYIAIDSKKNQVTYLPNNKTRSLKNPEEQIQLQTFCQLIYQYQYSPDQLIVSDTVKMGSSTKEADIVVYADSSLKSPLIIVECKKSGVSQKVFKEAIDQGFSYAAATSAQYVWVTSGEKNAYYEVWSQAIKERKQNVLPDIPKFQKEKNFFFQAKKVMYRLLNGVSFLRMGKTKWKIPPLLVDTLLHALIIFLVMTLMSRATVEYFPEIYQSIKSLWVKYGMHFGWLYYFISLIAIFLGLTFSTTLISNLQFLPQKRKKGRNSRRRNTIILTSLLFSVTWYLGSLQDLGWWSYANYERLNLKTTIYLIPFFKSVPFHIGLLYGLLWLKGRKKSGR